MLQYNIINPFHAPGLFLYRNGLIKAKEVIDMFIGITYITISRQEVCK